MSAKGIGAFSLSLVLGMGTLSSTALAELPEAARRMLDTVIATGDKAAIQVVAGTIIETYPEEAEAVRAYLSASQNEPAGEALVKIDEAATNETSVVPKVAIVPPPAVAPPPVTGFIGFDGWGGDIQLAGSVNTGNTTEKAAGVGIRLERKGDSWRHFVNGALDFTRTNGATTKQRLRVNYELNYDIDSRSYIFGSTEYIDDRFGGYSYRIVAAGGYGHRLIVEDDMAWEVQAGPGYRFSAVRGTTDTEEELIGLAASSFRWQISDGANLSNEVNFLYGSENATIDTRTAVTMAINAALSGRVSFESTTNTSPPAGTVTKKTDTQTKASLVYGF